MEEVKSLLEGVQRTKLPCNVNTALVVIIITAFVY